MGNKVNSNDASVTILEQMYPVGSIYMNGSSEVNPSLLLGFGTWDYFSEGRTIFGIKRPISVFDPDFTMGTTGGTKTHTLTEAQMPSHSHRQQGTNQVSTGGGTFTSGTNQNNGPNAHSYFTQETGGGESFSLLNPYITVAIWIRTA